MHIKLEDLPPKMQAQAIRIMAEEDKRREEKKALKNSQPQKTDLKPEKEFDSRGEYEFYIGTVLPKLQSGELVKCDKHPAFELFGRGDYEGLKLGAIRYTADFKLEYADGKVEIVEVKSRFVRHMQRDYPVRRRIFIEQYARPNGWLFTEIITDDRKEDIWKSKKAKL